jgi:hypothetical protein
MSAFVDIPEVMSVKACHRSSTSGVSVLQQLLEAEP